VTEVLAGRSSCPSTPPPIPMKQTQTASLTKDTWHLLLDFSFNISPDLSNFDEDGRWLRGPCRRAPFMTRSCSTCGALCVAGAWPLIIDDFVVFARKAIAAGGGAAGGAAAAAGRK
jgi:hypothetical protein